MKQYFSFQWHITDECDQRCKHCYIFSGDKCKKLTSMTWEQIQDTFYNCLDFCKMYNRQPYFYITGGDPILHPNFWDLLGLIKEHNISFTILGNPFHLTDEVCKRLKEHGCKNTRCLLTVCVNCTIGSENQAPLTAHLKKISALKTQESRALS